MPVAQRPDSAKIIELDLVHKLYVHVSQKSCEVCTKLLQTVLAESVLCYTFYFILFMNIE